MSQQATSNSCWRRYGYNSALSDEGQAGKYGLQVGATLYDQVRRGVLSDDLMTLAMRLSSAASDARMDGAMLPVPMSNSGSGNQGIAAETMPVVAAARVVKANTEQLMRAITLSHIVAIYIKSHQESLLGTLRGVHRRNGVGHSDHMVAGR